jgi:transcriptional regulator with XRE-family HTH domain
MKAVNIQAKRLGKVIQAKRISKGLSKADLAKGSKLSTSVIDGLERGEGLNLDDLVMIAKALKTTLADLFEEAGL